MNRAGVAEFVTFIIVGVVGVSVGVDTLDESSMLFVVQFVAAIAVGRVVER